MSKQRKIHPRVVQQLKSYKKARRSSFLKGYTNEPRWRQRINLLLGSGLCIRWESRLSYCVLGSRTGWVNMIATDNKESKKDK